MKYGRIFKILSVALALGFVALVPARSHLIVARPDAPTVPGQSNVPGQPVPTGSKGGTVQPTSVGVPPPKAGLQCNRTQNGGATDAGVTADKIRLASTVVQSGPGASFLSASPFAMQAVVRKVNRAGGICGRLLDLTLVDDGWDAGRGLGYIKTFIAEKYFALPVVPSSEGLTAAIESRDIGNAGIPVIGTDGMLKQQYNDKWVWPVATATVSTMRIMAKFGYGKGARCFGIVWDQKYRLGREGAEAFRNLIKKQKGAKMCADVGIYPSQASYSSEIQQFNTSCASKCDFVAWLLEPGTALTWVAGTPQMGSLYTAGAQTLFNEQFASNCGKACNGMLVWTGYNPPIGNLAGLPEVKQYVNDVKTVNPTIDTTNQFAEGAYLGMSIFVEALQRVGPDLTRARLAAVMNSQTFKSDISSMLHWTQGERHANRSAQAFSMVVAQGSFAGFKNEQTGFIPDPE